MEGGREREMRKGKEVKKKDRKRYMNKEKKQERR
jgi:hypothetical protein